MRVLVAGAVVAGALALPAMSSAATTIGSSFMPTRSCLVGTFYMTNYASQGHDAFLVPADGVITSWSFQGPEPQPFSESVPFTAQLKVGTRISKTEFRTDANGESIEVKPYVLATAKDRVPVAAGQRIGVLIKLTGLGKAYCAGSGEPDNVEGFVRNTEPKDQEPGMTGQYLELGSWNLPLSAVIEPDADHDGYGDETQDLCPTNPGPGPCPPVVTTPPAGSGGGGGSDGTGGSSGSSGGAAGADTTKPSLSGFTFPKATLKSAAGAKFDVTLSEPSTLSVEVDRQAPGRKVGGHCLPATTKNGSKPHCKMWVKVGSFKVLGKAGANSVPLPSKVGGKPLGPGSYELVATAADPSQNVSPPQTLHFKITG